MSKKKNKKNKNSIYTKEAMAGLIVVVELILILVTYVSFYEYKKDNDNNIKDNSLYNIYIFDNYMTSKEKEVNNSSNIVGTYDCKNDDCRGISIDEDYFVIYEDNKMFIYDYVNSKIITKKYDNITNSLNDYYIVTNKGSYGLLNNKGIEIIKPIYDKIDNYITDNIIIKDNNKYDIININNKKSILEDKYDNISVVNDKYILTNNNLSLVADLDGNILSLSYEDIYPFNEGFIALKDSKLNFYKYDKEQEKLLNDISIDTIKNNYSISKDNDNIIINTLNKKYIYNCHKNILNK